jgi:hypothetical protein
MLEVSDHTVLRHLQRVAGVDVEALRRAIAVSLGRAARTADAIGQDNYDICMDGYRYIVRRRVVVTVVVDRGY